MNDTEQIEMQLLLEAMKLGYGYDFTEYTADTLKRRVTYNLSRAGFDHISDLIPKVLHDPEYFESIIKDISITVTEMFRDPSFYLSLRKNVMPKLDKYSRINIWDAGCATGQEVYSVGIVLKEEGLYEKSHLYATDINNAALKKAEEGIYSAENFRGYTENYQKAGGRESFADYYHAKYDSALIEKSLKKNITFANHNLVTDGVFAETQLIICRNVFIYFEQTLQDNILKLFLDSLCDGGFLCLGKSESIRFSEYGDNFAAIDENENIFQKVSSKSDMREWI